MNINSKELCDFELKSEEFVFLPTLLEQFTYFQSYSSFNLRRQYLIQESFERSCARIQSNFYTFVSSLMQEGQITNSPSPIYSRVLHLGPR